MKNVILFIIGDSTHLTANNSCIKYVNTIQVIFMLTVKINIYTLNTFLNTKNKIISLYYAFKVLISIIYYWLQLIFYAKHRRVEWIDFKVVICFSKFWLRAIKIYQKYTKNGIIYATYNRLSPNQCFRLIITNTFI